MNEIYIGPLWGHDNFISELPENTKIIFYGGYLHFSGTNNVINSLMSLTGDRFVFHESRFEESFLISAGVIEETNYQFRRWLNPFSGILSAYKNYGISPLAVLKDPENISDSIKSNLHFQKHLFFFQNLKKEVLPEVINRKIEESILDKSAFKHLSFYDQNGSIIKQLPHSPELAENYVRETMQLLEEHAQQ